MVYKSAMYVCWKTQAFASKTWAAFMVGMYWADPKSETDMTRIRPLRAVGAAPFCLAASSALPVEAVSCCAALLMWQRAIVRAPESCVVVDSRSSVEGGRRGTVLPGCLLCLWRW